MKQRHPLALIIHGGAWDIPEECVSANRTGMLRALASGWQILEKGGTAVDAVEHAVMSMEDDETFDAGRGSFLNAAGEIELDASIMNGKTFRAGAVAAVQTVVNPISVARVIMEKSDDILLVGMGAARFAREHKPADGAETGVGEELIQEKKGGYGGGCRSGRCGHDRRRNFHRRYPEQISRKSGRYAAHWMRDLCRQ